MIDAKYNQVRKEKDKEKKNRLGEELGVLINELEMEDKEFRKARRQGEKAERQAVPESHVLSYCKYCHQFFPRSREAYSANCPYCEATVRFHGGEMFRP